MLTVGRWALKLAKGWEAEHEEGCVGLTHPDGYGVLLISHGDRPKNPVTRHELEQLAAAELPGDADLGNTKMGDFEGLHATYVEDGERWHRFYLCFGTLLLLITYTVEIAHDGAEDDAIIGMLRTLRATGNPWE